MAAVLGRLTEARSLNLTRSPEQEAAIEAATAERIRREQESERIRAQAARQRDWAELARKVGRRYDSATFEGFERKTAEQTAVVDSLQQYAADFPDRLKAGQGVVLYGPRGTGKDHLAVATLRRCVLDHGATARWFDGQTFYGVMRDRIGEDASESEVIRLLCDYDVLLISDPLPQAQDSKLTDFQQSAIWRIVDRRYRDMKPTWVTLNVSGKEELEKRIGAQIADRLLDSSLCLKCNWPTYRKPAVVVK